MGAGNGRRSCTAGMTVMLAVLVFAGTALYLTVDPESSALFPKCPFHLLTGLECPGCGSQRAIHSLLNGKIGQALHYNLLVVIAIPYLGLLAVLEIIRHILLHANVPDKTRSKWTALVSKTVSVLYHGRAPWIILSVVLLFWIVRNLTPAF